MWLKLLGTILFMIGMIMVMIPGVDELLFLTPLILIFGVIIIPIYYTVGFACLIIGAGILGVYLLPLLKAHKIVLVLMVIVLFFVIFIVCLNLGLIGN